MTVEEFYSSPLFKLMKNYLIKKYPWVKTITVPNETYLNEHDLVGFFDVDIDPIEMVKMYGWEMMPHTKWAKDNMYDGRYEGPLLTSFVTDEHRDEANKLADEIRRQLKMIQKSQALPDEYKQLKTYFPLTYIWDDRVTKTN